MKSLTSHFAAGFSFVQHSPNDALSRRMNRYIFADGRKPGYRSLSFHLRIELSPAKYKRGFLELGSARTLVPGGKNLVISRNDLQCDPGERWFFGLSMLAFVLRKCDVLMLT